MYWLLTAGIGTIAASFGNTVRVLHASREKLHGKAPFLPGVIDLQSCLFSLFIFNQSIDIVGFCWNHHHQLVGCKYLIIVVYFQQCPIWNDDPQCLSHSVSDGWLKHQSTACRETITGTQRSYTSQVSMSSIRSSQKKRPLLRQRINGWTCGRPISQLVGGLEHEFYLSRQNIWVYLRISAVSCLLVPNTAVAAGNMTTQRGMVHSSDFPARKSTRTNEGDDPGRLLPMC